MRTGEAFSWFQISLCREPGTNIFVQGMRETNEVIFGVYQPQGGSTWQVNFRSLHDRIAARWPKKISFNGMAINTPEWARRTQNR